MSPLLLLLLLLFLILTPASMLEFRYHNNREMEQYLLQINASNPDITHLYSIGQSVKGISSFSLCQFCWSFIKTLSVTLPHQIQLSTDFAKQIVFVLHVNLLRLNLTWSSRLQVTLRTLCECLSDKLSGVCHSSSPDTDWVWVCWHLCDHITGVYTQVNLICCSLICLITHKHTNTQAHRPNLS